MRWVGTKAGQSPLRPDNILQKMVCVYYYVASIISHHYSDPLDLPYLSTFVVSLLRENLAHLVACFGCRCVEDELSAQ